MDAQEALYVLQKGLEGDHHPAVIHAIEQVALRSSTQSSRHARAEAAMAGDG
jgi:hypothetical protein